MFGSCWGMQVAVSALGGKIRKNPKGPEVGIAHEITLTSEGENHPMYKNKPQTFYAPAFHLDEVETLPKGSVILSYNDMSAVQSISIKSGNAIFWGPQYHPELHNSYLKEGPSAGRACEGSTAESRIRLADDDAVVREFGYIPPPDDYEEESDDDDDYADDDYAEEARAAAADTLRAQYAALGWLPAGFPRRPGNH